MRRIKPLDLARGFTIFIMPAVHVVMLYSTHFVQASPLGFLLKFLAEGPGAQLFMLIMGVSMTLSSKVKLSFVLRRSFYLMIAAYGLNFLKFGIPLLLHWFPLPLLHELGFHSYGDAFVPLLKMGDIFIFASLAYIFIYFVYTLPLYHLWATGLVVVIIFLSPYIWDLQTGNNFVDYILTLFGGHPPQVFFPFFPWIVYPLAGLTVGKFIKINFANFAAAGIILIMMSGWLPAAKPEEWLPFYRTGPKGTCYHLGLVLVWLYLWDFICFRIKPERFFKLLTFLSKHITTVYILQWVIIMLVLPFAGYHTSGFLSSTIFILIISTLSFYLTYLIYENLRHYRDRHRAFQFRPRRPL